MGGETASTRWPSRLVGLPTSDPGDLEGDRHPLDLLDQDKSERRRSTVRLAAQAEPDGLEPLLEIQAGRSQHVVEHLKAMP